MTKLTNALRMQLIFQFISVEGIFHDAKNAKYIHTSTSVLNALRRYTDNCQEISN